MTEDESASPLEQEDVDAFRAAKASGAPQKRVDPDAGSEVQPDAATNKAIQETGVAGLGVIHGLVNATFFYDLFCYHAHRRFRHGYPENRVAAMIDKHPRFYKLCRYSDYIYRALAATALLGGVGAIAVGSIVKVFFS